MCGVDITDLLQLVLIMLCDFGLRARFNTLCGFGGLLLILITLYDFGLRARSMHFVALVVCY